MFFVLLVLDDPRYVDDVLSAWNEAGVGGATILESSGLHRRQAENIHMRHLYSAFQFISSQNITIFSLVSDQDMVDTCLREVEKIVGDLNDPHTGVFTAWPAGFTKGAADRGRSDGTLTQ